MKILSINSENNNLRFFLFDMKDESIIADGIFERIGLDGSTFTIKLNDEKIVQEIEVATQEDAIPILIDKLISLEVIKTVDEISGFGHRVVYGKDMFKESVMVTDDVMAKLDSIKEYTSIYGPVNNLVIAKCKELYPNIPNVAVFDTSFNHTIEEVNYLYSVPYKWYKDYGIRKYGYHGTSHRYITECVQEILGRDDFKLISCHLGTVGSISAIKNLECVDTSTGFTPLAGVMTGTKSGDIDPSILPFVMEREGKNVGEILDDLNRNSGLLGLSEFSSDMRDINAKCDEGDERALVARAIYVRKVVNYIAQYYVLLGGADVIAFTAGIGENSIPVRRLICEALAPLGVKIDLDANNSMGEKVKISTDESKVEVWVIPTQEGLMIARDTFNIIKNR